MTQTITQLLESVEREHRALITLVEKTVDDGAMEDLDAIHAHHEAMEPIMRRLGESTRRLAFEAAKGGVPAPLAEKIASWQGELESLNVAVQEQAREMTDRRVLIRNTLGKLNQWTKGAQGYRAKTVPDARFVTKRA